MNQEIILVSGVFTCADRPQSCRGCFCIAEGHPAPGCSPAILLDGVFPKTVNGIIIALTDTVHGGAG